ncbi:MAG: lipopolysaccharide transport periplasmic protein LptA [Gammaproteobacteria bacterium]|nr:lipopolysaccharide transport periplasmic protein LptA [Gammaproteobacteria bacterium]
MYCLQNKFYLNLFWLFIFLTLNLCVNPAHAAKQQTIDIHANYLLLDENKGISIYKGKVLFTKDTLVIKADTVTLYYDGEKLTKAEILGSPADVRHEPDNEEKVHSQANKMEYFIAEEKLTLKGRAFVDQGARHFSGEYIEYDTRQRIITAAGEQNKVTTAETLNNSPTNNRVHVIIGPTEDAANAVDTENVEKNNAQTSDKEYAKP